MRLAVRTFLWSFVPLALLLTASFWAAESAVVTVVRSAVRSSLRDHQLAIARMEKRDERQNRRYLKILGENASLRAGLQILLGAPASDEARLTLEDQLRELCATSGIDFLMISTGSGVPLAGVLRKGDSVAPVDVAAVLPPQRGMFLHDGGAYQITSVPVDQNGENLALLSVGERQDFADFGTPVVLMHGDAVIESTLAGFRVDELQRALAGCGRNVECEVKLGNQTWLSLATTGIRSSDGYTVRSLVNVDSAEAPVQAVLRSVFTIAGAGAMLAALVLTMVSALSVVKPIQRVVAQLRESERTGALTEFDTRNASVREIRELIEGFNRAAGSVRESRDRLDQAYVEFVGSLASALDARDPYTAGHSSRVSELSCAIATAMRFNTEELEILRIGALLHDIGKIGVPDAILGKPGRLTAEEFASIQQHPAIGRSILEGVHGFAPYLSIVELHHENWDGTGYPHGLHGEDVPLSARIVHVADAYDAMTSDRPYRSGMSCEKAVRILRENAGTQFDAVVVDALTALLRPEAVDGMHQRADERSLLSLAAAVESAASTHPVSGGRNRG